MEYTKKQIKYNWKKDIEDFAYKLQYPFDENYKNHLAKSLSAIPEESSDTKSSLTSYSEATNYNAPIGQEYDDYQYSYEEGYFKAFKLVIAGSSNDSESFLMPALFLARHYIELSLKDEITNVSIATGSKFNIGNKESHCLTELSNSFKKLLDENDLNILQEKFFDIIESIDKLSPKSDEFRYTTDVSGKYNLPIDFTDDKESPSVVNLIVLGQYLNYIYLNYSYFEANGTFSIAAHWLKRFLFFTCWVYKKSTSRAIVKLTTTTTGGSALYANFTSSKIFIQPKH